MGERSTNRSKAAPLYVFVIVAASATPAAPRGEVFFWTREAARGALRQMPAGVASALRIRRAKLTVFNK